MGAILGKQKLTWGSQVCLKGQREKALFSKYGPWAGSIGIIRGFARSEQTQVPPRHKESETANDSSACLSS